MAAPRWTSCSQAYSCSRPSPCFYMRRFPILRASSPHGRAKPHEKTGGRPPVFAFIAVIRPESSSQRIGRLDRGVELGGVAALLARTVARTLAPAKRHMEIDACRRQVDHHHARFRIALEVGRIFQARRADARRQAEIRIIG